MIDDKNKTKNCQIHVMPPSISDEDISALFNGILNVVKKKFELETKASIINLNSSIEKLMKELKKLILLLFSLILMIYFHLKRKRINIKRRKNNQFKMKQ